MISYDCKQPKKNIYNLSKKNLTYESISYLIISAGQNMLSFNGDSVSKKFYHDKQYTVKPVLSRQKKDLNDKW